ncbi:aminopeptidase [Longispora fulva]|uniref:Aminopeptidase N n=1 Tax=Longispora fulva TaxID=619741 RepID=A0A8J7KJD3_9ACTN|nr:aminopeptidase N [Longispora fulva]MBG6136789.1 aminopeptidase N [Longispora fulva]GIG59960.1 aminopeptidase [Longispora fulva]
MPALQRTEARTRAHLIDVHGYQLDLDLTRGEDVFGCTTVIRFSCARPGADTFLDLRPAALNRVVLNGRPLDPAGLDDHRLALTDLAAENELLVEADMAYSRTGEGLHRFTDPTDDARYVYAACGPDHAPRMFPCFDQPDLKAPFTVAVTAPPEWTVLANAAGEARGAGRWEFAPTLPISTYLVTVVGGPLHSVHDEHDGIPLGLHCRRSLAADLDREADELFEVTRASFDRLHELFAERYVFGRYDQAFVPELNWGAMENPGCVVFAEEALFHSPPTEAQRTQRAVVVAHEMAHMWFGDLVTMRWWDDLWLNESFAEYLGFRIAAENTRFTDAWTGFAVARKHFGFDADQRPTTHPVAATGLESLSEAMANFDGIAYAKGAAVLRQLVAWLGDEAFFAGVNAHLARHRFGNAELADLLDALAAASGRDVHGWAELWLRTSGMDSLRVERGTLVATGTRPHLVAVGVFDGEPPVLRDRHDLEVPPGGRIALPEPARGGPPQTASAPPAHSFTSEATSARPGGGREREAGFVLPNLGDLTWAKVRLDDSSWREVARTLSRIADPETRAVLWSIARDMVRDADLAPRAYLDLVAEHLPAERLDSIVEAVLTFAGTRVVDSYLPPDERPAGHELLAGVGRRLLDAPDAAPGLRLAALRATIDNAVGDPAGLEKLLAGADLGTELRWAALTRLAAGDAIDDDRLAAELAADPSSSAHLGAATARAALPGAEAKERAWGVLFGADAPSTYVLAATARGFWQSGATEEYVRRYFADVAGVGERGDIVAMTLGGRALFPVGHSTPGTVRAAEECLAGPDLTPALRRALADQLDELHRAVRIRAAG